MIAATPSAPPVIIAQDVPGRMFAPHTAAGACRHVETLIRVSTWHLAVIQAVPAMIAFP